MVVIIRSNTSMKCKNRITCCEIFVFVLVFAITKLLSTVCLRGGADAAQLGSDDLSVTTHVVASGQRIRGIVTLAVNVE